MGRAKGDQGSLFGPPVPSRPARRRQPPKQTTITITADAIAAMTVGRISAERIIAEAIRAVRPDVRNVVVDLGTIRWTDPKTSRRVIFDTPAVLRDALLGFTHGIAPEPFRCVLGAIFRSTSGD